MIIQFNEDGTSTTILNNRDLNYNKLIYLLTTNPGEDSTNLEYGTNLRSIKLLPINMAQKFAENVIKEAVTKFMPYIEIDKVTVSKVEGNLQIHVSVKDFDVDINI